MNTETPGNETPAALGPTPTAGENVSAVNEWGGLRVSTTATSSALAGAGDFDELSEVAGRVRRAMEQVIEGKPDVVEVAITVLLAEGHLLIEDVPGVGKTMLAKSIDCSVRRIQFTPDLLPSDITGVSVFNQEIRDFEFKPGAVFANIVVGDEINRASPKTQAALLESMEERQVTVDTTTYQLEAPFMARVAMGYPEPAAELRMLDGHAADDPLLTLQPVTDGQQILRLVKTVQSVHVSESVKEYAIALVGATRRSQELRLGASPRSTLHLIRAARAAAALDAREFVLPDDIQELAVPVLAHRVLPAAEAHLGGRGAADIISGLVATVPLPRTRRD